MYGWSFYLPRLRKRGKTLSSTRNKDIKAAIKTAGLYQYQVADTLGIDETKLSKMLRYDLSKTDRESILQAVAITKINQQEEAQ